METKADADAEVAAADEAAAKEDSAAAAAATEESAEAKAKAADSEAQVGEARAEELEDQARAGEASASAAAHEAAATAEREEAYWAVENAAATEAQAEADEATTGILTFIPGIDLVADTVGCSVAAGLHVKEALETAAAARLAAQAGREQGQASENTASAAKAEAEAEAAEAKAEATSAEMARQSAMSKEATETAKREEEAAVEMQEEAANEEAAAAKEQEAAAAEEAIATENFRKAAFLRLGAFFFQVLALVLISPLALCVAARKATKSSRDLVTDCLAIGVTLNGFLAGFYLFNGRKESPNALLESNRDVAMERNVARGIVLQHLFGLQAVLLFVAPVWLRCVKDVGHTAGGDLAAVTVAAVVGAKCMILATMKAAGLILGLVFLKYLIDHWPRKVCEIDETGEQVEDDHYHEMLKLQVWRHALGKAFEAGMRTFTTGLLLLVVALFFSFELQDVSASAFDFMIHTWNFRAWGIVAVVALITALASLHAAWESPACQLWSHDKLPVGIDMRVAKLFLAALKSEYVEGQTGAMSDFYSNEQPRGRDKLYLENLSDLIQDVGEKERERMISMLELGLGLSPKGAAQRQVEDTKPAQSSSECGHVGFVLFAVVAFLEAEIEALILGLSLKQWLSSSTIFALVWPSVWARLPGKSLVLPWLLVFEGCDLLLACLVYHSLQSAS